MKQISRMEEFDRGQYEDIEFLGSASTRAGELLEAFGRGLLFDQFYQHEIEELASFMHCFLAPAGTILLREGEIGDHLIVVLSGRVTVSKQDLTGKTHPIAMIGPGGILGEISLVDAEPRFATCTAVEPTRFAVLTRTDLNEIMALHARLANKVLFSLLTILASRLRDSGQRAIAPLQPLSKALV